MQKKRKTIQLTKILYDNLYRLWKFASASLSEMLLGAQLTFFNTPLTKYGVSKFLSKLSVRSSSQTSLALNFLPT